MFVSKRLLILPLGLMITLSGCSGSRMRQIFSPDREFMSLSELEEYEAKKRGLSTEESNSGQFLAALRGNRDEQGDEEDRSIVNLSRWLSSRKDKTLPADPFLEDSVGESTYDGPAVAVGHSRELPAENPVSPEQVDPVDHTLPEIEFGDTAEVAVEAVVEDVTAAPAGDDKLTFAQIMADLEFEEEDEQDEVDPLEAMEQEWLARQSAQAEPDAESGTTDFDALLAESVQETSGDVNDDDTPALNFDDSETETADRDDAIPYLTEADVDSDAHTAEDDVAAPFGAVEEDDDSVEITFSGPALPRLPAEELLDSVAPLDESLWQSADVVAQNETPAGDDPQQSSSSTETPDLGSWDFGPAGAAASGLQLPPSLPATTSVEPDELTPNRTALHRPATAISQAVAVAESTPVFADDEFLNDFESQAAAASSTPPESPGQPKPAMSVMAGQSPRTWLLLLGGVVIAYLVFAPERQNLRHPNRQ